MYEQLDQALDRVARSRTYVSPCCAAPADTSWPERTSRSSRLQVGRRWRRDYERRLEAVIAKLESLPVATIAAVEGYAVGVGLVLAAACDLRIAIARRAVWRSDRENLGNCLSMANYARLVAALGASRTKAMLLTADLMPAEEARAIGFVLRRLEPDAFDSQSTRSVRALVTRTRRSRFRSRRRPCAGSSAGR